MNATLSAVYAESADYLGEAVTLTSQGNDTPLAARFDPAERRLIVDQAQLSPSTTYTLAWPSLRGLTTAGHGLGKTITFSTGERSDSETPRFTGVKSLSWDLVHPRDPCTDDLEARLRFRLGLGEASDDGGRESLTLLLFQTDGKALPDATPRFVAARALPASDHTDIDLAPADAGGSVCFAAIVRDLVGNVSATGSHTRCVETTAPPIFYECAWTRTPGSPYEPFIVVGLAALLGLRRRRAP